MGTSCPEHLDKRLTLWYLWGTHEIRHMASSIPPKKMIEIANYHDIAKNRGDDDEGKGRSPGHVQVAPFAEKDQTNYIHQLIY